MTGRSNAIVWSRCQRPADQRACLAALENLHAKYAVTAQAIESQRDAAAAKLKGFLKELGYE